MDSEGNQVQGQVTVAVSEPGGYTSSIVSINVREGGVVVLAFEGSPSVTYVIEACDDLATADWHPIGESTADTSGAFEFSDAESISRNGRYYRSRWP